MEEPGENEGAAGVVGHAYFVVRLHTGEKRAFATAAEPIGAPSRAAQP
jgi:hypothetical protein